MEKISFSVGKEFCEECSMALRRFVGNMDGVDSIDVEEGKIGVVFDSEKISGEELFRITRESMEKLGYKLKE